MRKRTGLPTDKLISAGAKKWSPTVKKRSVVPPDVRYGIRHGRPSPDAASWQQSTERMTLAVHDTICLEAAGRARRDAPLRWAR